MKLTTEQIKIILQLNDLSVKSDEIALRLNVPLKAIKNCLREQSRKSINSRNEYNVKLRHDYFDNIDTAEKAYLVGLLAADGNINKNSLRLRVHPSDRELVDFMCKQLNWLKNPTITKNGKDGKSQVVNVSLRSTQLTSMLLNRYGFAYNKTYVNLFNDFGDLTKFFLLGLFDGDGSIFYSSFNRKSGTYAGKSEESYRFSYTGNVQTAQAVVDYLASKNIELKLYTLKKNNKIAYVHTSKIQSLIDLNNYLYIGHELGLKRKRLKFAEAVKFYIKRDVQRL